MSADPTTGNTPPPWKIAQGDNGLYHDGATAARVIVAHRDGNFRCVAMAYHGDHDRDANAALIVRAVNSHAALVKALTTLRDQSVHGFGLCDASECLYCHGEAPNHHDGTLAGPVRHEPDCILPEVEAALKLARGDA